MAMSRYDVANYLGLVAKTGIGCFAHGRGMGSQATENPCTPAPDPLIIFLGNGTASKQKSIG